MLLGPPRIQPSTRAMALRLRGGLWVSLGFVLERWGRISEILLMCLRGLKWLGWAEEGSVPPLSSAVGRTRHRGIWSGGLWGGSPTSCSARTLVCSHC